MFSSDLWVCSLDRSCEDLRDLTPTIVYDPCISPRLTPLLAKDSTAEDPARVINISSVASVSAHAEETALAASGMGLWSCECPGGVYIESATILTGDFFLSDNTSKAAGEKLVFTRGRQKASSRRYITKYQ